MTDQAERDAYGVLLDRPGAPFRDLFPWASNTDDPKVLHCIICKTDLPKFYLAVIRHAAKHPADKS